MNIVFFGTDSFAKSILEYLLSKNVNIVAVVTRPDKAKGRSGKATPPPVKSYLDKIGFSKPIFQPLRASNEEFVVEIQGLAPDLFVVVSYGQIIKQKLLDIPKSGAINVHPSLLPKYRGPSPIQTAVLNGEKEVGVTIMEMVLELDAGDILKVVKLPLPENMTFGELEEKLCNESKEPLLEVVTLLEQNRKISKIVQDDSQATFTKKITSEDSWINWDRPADEVHNFIRGMNPKPGARCFLKTDSGKKLIKIFRSKIIDIPSDVPGKTLIFNSKEGWIIGCKDFALQILEVQPEGKKKLNIKDFINGFSFPILIR